MSEGTYVPFRSKDWYEMSVDHYENTIVCILAVSDIDAMELASAILRVPEDRIMGEKLGFVNLGWRTRWMYELHMWIQERVRVCTNTDGSAFNGDEWHIKTLKLYDMVDEILLRIDCPKQTMCIIHRLRKNMIKRRGAENIYYSEIKFFELVDSMPDVYP